MLPNICRAISESGTDDFDNVAQGIIPSATMVIKVPRTPTTIVPITSAFGMTFSGSLVSSERYVAFSHPKKLSEMKNAVIRIDETPEMKNGVKFDMFISNSPGRTNDNKTE